MLLPSPLYGVVRPWLWVSGTECHSGPCTLAGCMVAKCTSAPFAECTTGRFLASPMQVVCCDGWGGLACTLPLARAAAFALLTCTNDCVFEAGQRLHCLPGDACGCVEPFELLPGSAQGGWGVSPRAKIVPVKDCVELHSFLQESKVSSVALRPAHYAFESARFVLKPATCHHLLWRRIGCAHLMH